MKRAILVNSKLVEKKSEYQLLKFESDDPAVAELYYGRFYFKKVCITRLQSPR